MSIDNLLFELYNASILAHDDEHHTPWAYEALKWYISTDRASLDFIQACENLSKKRKITLMKKCSVACTEDAIKNAKKYLKV